MSFIFDALRKSEAHRRDGAAAPVSVQFTAAPPRRWPWLLAGAMLLIAALIWLGWLLRGTPPAPTAALSSSAPNEQAIGAIPAKPRSDDPVRPLADEVGMPAAREKQPSEMASAARTASDPSVMPSRPARTPRDTQIPALAAMPHDFKAALPPLNMQVHAYAQAPAQRFVIINLHRYHEGDSLPGGLRVQAIRPQGAVLVFHGKRFLLQR